MARWFGMQFQSDSYRCVFSPLCLLKSDIRVSANDTVGLKIILEKQHICLQSEQSYTQYTHTHTHTHTHMLFLFSPHFLCCSSLSLPPTAAGLSASPTQLTRIRWRPWEEPLLSTDDHTRAHKHTKTHVHTAPLYSNRRGAGNTDGRWCHRNPHFDVLCFKSWD